MGRKKLWRAADEQDRSRVLAGGGYWRIGKDGRREWVPVHQQKLPGVASPVADDRDKYHQGELW